MDPNDIYNSLKNKIIWLELAPGSTLNQVELAQAYGVSRTPLTIALTRLNGEDWVLRQGSHFVVSPLTLERMREITEIRSVLEMQANVWTMNRITPAGLAELKDLGKAIENLAPTATKREIFTLDYRFHSLLYREARNNQLAQLLEHILGHYIRFWLADPNELNQALFFSEANEIIRAIEAKDELTLRASTATHIKVSLNRIMHV